MCYTRTLIVWHTGFYLKLKGWIHRRGYQMYSRFSEISKLTRDLIHVGWSRLPRRGLSDPPRLWWDTLTGIAANSAHLFIIPAHLESTNLSPRFPLPSSLTPLLSVEVSNLFSLCDLPMVCAGGQLDSHIKWTDLISTLEHWFGCRNSLHRCSCFYRTAAIINNKLCFNSASKSCNRDSPPPPPPTSVWYLGRARTTRDSFRGMLTVQIAVDQRRGWLFYAFTVKTPSSSSSSSCFTRLCVVYWILISVCFVPPRMYDDATTILVFSLCVCVCLWCRCLIWKQRAK